MSKPNDGGPAFPTPAGPEPRVGETTHYNEGMSRRDYYMAHAPMSPALPDYIAISTALRRLARQQARWAAAYADAMLAERGKENKP